MKMTEFEDRLHRHAADVKAAMPSPFELEPKMPRPALQRRGGRKGLLLIAVAAVFLLGTTAFAAGAAGGWFAGREKEYTQLPEAEQYISDVGYAPVLIGKFKNGYTFAGGYVENNISGGEDGDIHSFKSSTFEYENEGRLLWFSQAKSGCAAAGQGSLCKSCEGIELWYYCYINKFVPEDYEPDEADRQAEAQGKLIITYGPEEISLVKVSSLSWTVDGINYTLMQMDGELSEQELCAMAEEIILSGKEKIIA